MLLTSSYDHLIDAESDVPYGTMQCNNLVQSHQLMVILISRIRGIELSPTSPNPQPRNPAYQRRRRGRSYSKSLHHEVFSTDKSLA